MTSEAQRSRTRCCFLILSYKHCKSQIRMNLAVLTVPPERNPWGGGGGGDGGCPLYSSHSVHCYK